MPESFKNLVEVLRYLQDQGYKIAKSKLYKDKTKGLLRIQDDKTFLASEVNLYAATLHKVLDEGKVAEDVSAKTRKEVEKLDIQIEQARFNLEKDKGKYIEKKKFDQELAARAAVLETGIKHMFQANVSEYAAIIGGDPLKANLLLDRMNLDYDSYINEYASTRKFQVIVIEKENTESV